jgi:hypothetical protein
LAELIDRMAVVQLKAIFIDDKAYSQELEDLKHDVGLLLTRKFYNADLDDDNPVIMQHGRLVHAILMVMLTNRYIWENENRARAAGSEQDKLLKLTHSINGVRNTAKNVISQLMGERVDLKVDCLAAELIAEFGNWNVFGRQS